MCKAAPQDAHPLIAVALCSKRGRVCSAHTLREFVGYTLDSPTNNVLNLDGVFGLYVIQYYI